MAVYDDGERRKVLESIGILDGSLDLDTYVNRLSIDLSEVFSINTAIKKHCVIDLTQKKETLMEGINFTEDT